MPRWVALLYSTVIGPNRRVRASDLTSLSDRLGLVDPRVVLSSGNLIFSAAGSETAHAHSIGRAVAALYGREVPVLVRSEAAWRRLIADNPFPQESERDPKNVGVRIMAAQPDDKVMARLAAKRQPGDLLVAGDRAIWAYAPAGDAGSPLLRAVNAGWAGVGTMRNASAVKKIRAGFD